MKCNIWRDCPKVPITELLSFIVDNRGKTVPTAPNGHKLIATNCVTNNTLFPVYEKVRYLSDETYNTWFRAHPVSGDILFVNKGTPGRVCMVPDPVDFCIAQDMIALRADATKIYNKYLFAVLRSREIQQQIYNTNVGDVIPHFKKQFLSQLLIPVPKYSVQKVIGDFYYLFSYKIELNNKINENLERQVAEIYKSWYQDFSRSANLPLVETEFGLIPQGWHYNLLGDLCKSISVTHKFDKNELVFLNTGDIENGQFLHSNYMSVKDMPGQAKKTIAPGDILYSEIRPINRHFAYVNFPSEDYVVSTKLMVIRANGFDTRRLYHYLTSEDILSELQMQAESRSGTFPQIRFDNVSKLPILIADEETEKAFITFLHTVYDQIECNNLERQKLAALRDALLPKLMSGEIDVSEIKF